MHFSKEDHDEYLEAVNVILLQNDLATKTPRSLILYGSSGSSGTNGSSGSSGVSGTSGITGTNGVSGTSGSSGSSGVDGNF